MTARESCFSAVGHPHPAVTEGERPGTFSVAYVCVRLAQELASFVLSACRVSMAATDKIIRDPIHGFIRLSPWEQEIVDHRVFQRLRRVKQLALTEMVYPAACHNRFEHSLGVMHVATQIFDQLRPLLESPEVTEPNFSKEDLDRARVVVRLAALLHDVDGDRRMWMSDS